MVTDNGRVPSGQALVASDGAATHLHPTGFDPSRGPFLIWSRKHSCWHRRDEDGGARGYTRDLTDAGIFDAKVALEYGDGVHNDAIALVDQLKPLADEVEDKRHALEDAQERHARFSAIAMETQRAETENTGSVAKP